MSRLKFTTQGFACNCERYNEELCWRGEAASGHREDCMAKRSMNNAQAIHDKHVEGLPKIDLTDGGAVGAQYDDEVTHTARLEDMREIK